MSDKEYNQLKKKITRLASLWRERLGLNTYRLHHSWDRTTKEKADNCGAEVKMRWEYLEADFTWYMPALKDLNDDELEECIVHEFCHVLIAPLMYDDSEHGRLVYERVTSTVQRAIGWTYEAGKEKKR